MLRLLALSLVLAPLAAQPVPLPDEGAARPAVAPPSPMQRLVTFHADHATVGQILDQLVEQAGVSVITTPSAREAGGLVVHLEAVPARLVVTGLQAADDTLRVEILGEHLAVVTRDLPPVELPATADVLHLRPILPLEPRAPVAPPSESEAQAEPNPSDEPEDELEIQPLSMAQVYYEAGCQHLTEGRLEEAMICFRRARKLDPDHEPTRKILEEHEGR
jgi:hypothetical protein